VLFRWPCCAASPCGVGGHQPDRSNSGSAIEAAAWLSLIVIAKLMQPASKDTRMLTLRYLDESADDDFRRFARYYQAISTNQAPERPADMPNLAPVLGFGFWYLGVAARENRLSNQCYRMFIGDVVNMLRGKSQDERRRDRMTNTVLNSDAPAATRVTET
jgi:hypothetical protein